MWQVVPLWLCPWIKKTCIFFSLSSTLSVQKEAGKFRKRDSSEKNGRGFCLSHSCQRKVFEKYSLANEKTEVIPFVEERLQKYPACLMNSVCFLVLPV